MTHTEQCATIEKRYISLVARRDHLQKQKESVDEMRRQVDAVKSGEADRQARIRECEKVILEMERRIANKALQDEASDAVRAQFKEMDNLRAKIEVTEREIAKSRLASDEYEEEAKRKDTECNFLWQDGKKTMEILAGKIHGKGNGDGLISQIANRRRESVAEIDRKRRSLADAEIRAQKVKVESMMYEQLVRAVSINMADPTAVEEEKRKLEMQKLAIPRIEVDTDDMRLDDIHAELERQCRVVEDEIMKGSVALSDLRLGRQNDLRHAVAIDRANFAVLDEEVKRISAQNVAVQKALKNCMEEIERKNVDAEMESLGEVIGQLRIALAKEKGKAHETVVEGEDTKEVKRLIKEHEAIIEQRLKEFGWTKEDDRDEATEETS